MALLTGQGCMGTGQWKIAVVMIKIHMIPTGGVMTGRTVFTKLPIMIVISLMTRIAIRGRAFELLIYVARLASHFHMPTL